MVERSLSIFGNAVDARSYKKACRAKEKFVRRFGDDTDQTCHLQAEPAAAIGSRLGTMNLVPAAPDGEGIVLPGNAVVVGNIRMGFGHYRIAMAMASAAHALGYAPYWLDFCGFPDTLASKVILHQNRLYSLGSRLSQRFPLFNKLYWEPLNSEGFRKLSYNAQDQKVSELFCVPLRDLPAETPFVGTHAWCAQAAVHAGFTQVVNAIPDNWPMALHLAEGAIHAVQTPFAEAGYRSLAGMDDTRQLQPMPNGVLHNTGHYVDHELVANVPEDCRRRVQRMDAGGAVRYLLTVGGAGAQQDLFCSIVAHLLPQLEAGKAVLFVNVGDHRKVWDALVSSVPALTQATCHFNDFAAVERFAEDALDGQVEGIHAFCDSELFSAVYTTNLLMRCCDVLVTKPSELSFYPVPKLMIKRVGGHEAYGAIRAAELGDGTPEMDTPDEICAMIDAIQQDRSIVANMCANICAETKRGTYNGAYRCIELATGRS